MAYVEPAPWGFAAKHDIHLQCTPRISLSQFRPSISTLTCRCAFGPVTTIASKSFQVPLASTGASSWSARPIKKTTGPDRKASERDAGVTTSEDGGALELVDTEGIIFEESDDINGMLRQPRSYSENWQMFAAEEGARPTDEDDTESDRDTENGSNETSVKRRKADEVLFPIPGSSAAANWSAADKQKVQALNAFQHRHESERGHFGVEAMRPKHMNDIEELLVDSFAELMGGLLTYRPLLAFTVKQYVRERYATLPHSVTLVGRYVPAEKGAGVPEDDGAGTGEAVVAGTVELSFSIAGHPDVPTPAPPPNSPYICNMAIKQEYRREYYGEKWIALEGEAQCDKCVFPCDALFVKRYPRRGLGRQMLKAAEDLALRMGCEDMYLHVRIMDTAPLTMYREAGYQVVSTDSLLSVLTFQRRRHLMRKRLCLAKLIPE